MVTATDSSINIKQIINKQSDFFRSKETLSLHFRLHHLKKLYKAIQDHEEDIYAALFNDFQKSRFEVYGTEIGLVLSEIKFFLKHLPKFVRPEKVKSSVVSFPARSYLYREPFGLSLIIGPWNYPFQLIFLPLVGSIAAGNCVILKPSELTKHTTVIINKIVQETFVEDYITVIEGGPETSSELLKNKFDHIFFTGSVKVGKIVYEAAAKNLTPCILELGGKSPCIIHKDANLDLAARRIVWGKFLNGGQTCVAPDYLLVHKNVKDDLLDKLAHYTEKFYGEDPKLSPDFPRIINDNNFSRLVSLITADNVLVGGKTDSSEKYIAPTILKDISWEDDIMQEEIFGPLLPVMEFDDLEQILEEIKDRPKPLALYLFSKSKQLQERVLKEIPFGGGCINDTLLQFGSTSLPVGGIGNSGLGSYHGKESFLAFSNTKSIVKKKTKIDIPFRYPPYAGKMGLLKLIFKL
jgi:aldehyde dehydrogenase (NAD+)